MKSLPPLLQIELHFIDYKFALLCFTTAFVVSMMTIPPLILIVNKYALHDKPDIRKEHSIPTPTLGGIAIIAGMIISLLLWFPGQYTTEILVSFFSMSVIFLMGITDDLMDLHAKYKFIIEVALGFLIALAGIRITSFGGLLGINQLPMSAQYTVTVFAIVGVTNAFNLIDGIDGLAGGLGFMCLVTLGIFLTLNGDKNFALIAFALAGGVLAFLYFNMNPAKIFMGDTGSLVLGLIISLLCVRIIQVSGTEPRSVLRNTPMFAMGVVFIPVFDAVRVFAMRMWKGQSPFTADRTHIHHLLINTGFSHSTSSRIICGIHALILLEAYWLNDLPANLILLALSVTMLLLTIGLFNLSRLLKFRLRSGRRTTLEI